MWCQQAEKFRAKAQRPEQSRSHTQYCRYLYYLGRIKAIQLEYTDARDYLQQAARKVCPSPCCLSMSMYLLVLIGQVLMLLKCPAPHVLDTTARFQQTYAENVI